MKHIFTIVVLSLGIISCERETKVDIPPQPQKLVGESLQGHNELPEARISRTRGVLETLPTGGQNDPYIVDNARVLLFEDDLLRDSLLYDAGTRTYKATSASVQAGKTYKVVLSAPGFPNAEASSSTPLLVPISNITFTRNARVSPDGNQQDELKLTFTDNGSTEDFYVIRILDAYGSYLYCIETNDKDIEKLVYDDPLYPEDCLRSDRLLMSDINFNGASKTLVFYADAGLLDQQTTPAGTSNATVQLLHINRDYYKYFKSVNSFENSVDNPFAEPVNLYTNMKNGYGLFTTYARVIATIQ